LEILAASKGKERSVITGLEVWHTSAITPGAKVKSGCRDVGVVTSTVFSQYLMKSLAMAQIDKGSTAFGTALETTDAGAIVLTRNLGVERAPLIDAFSAEPRLDLMHAAYPANNRYSLMGRHVSAGGNHDRYGSPLRQSRSFIFGMA
jgi:hypothetical protein